MLSILPDHGTVKVKDGVADRKCVPFYIREKEEKYRARGAFRGRAPKSAIGQSPSVRRRVVPRRETFCRLQLLTGHGSGCRSLA